MTDDSRGLEALANERAPTFHAPWQARAFAVAVALSNDGAYDWDAFQTRLAAELERTEDTAVPSDGADAEDDYYQGWLTALERLLVEDGIIESGELRDRVSAFAEGDRDASEWVAGTHDHDH